MTITVVPITRPSPAQASEPVMVPVEIIGARMGRWAEVYYSYKEALATAPTGCVFCSTERLNEQQIVQLSTMLIIGNAFPYAVWDSALVEEHLMIVPVRHVLSFDEFTDEEAADHWALCRRYEAAGYSVYTRSQGNKGRSVGHLHTHLIKTGAFYRG